MRWPRKAWGLASTKDARTPAVLMRREKTRRLKVFFVRLVRPRPCRYCSSRFCRRLSPAFVRVIVPSMSGLRDAYTQLTAGPAVPIGAGSALIVSSPAARRVRLARPKDCALNVESLREQINEMNGLNAISAG